jgi:hypothetical protein
MFGTTYTPSDTDTNTLMVKRMAHAFLWRPKVLPDGNDPKRNRRRKWLVRASWRQFRPLFSSRWVDQEWC